jgi:hypothetical protein
LTVIVTIRRIKPVKDRDGGMSAEMLNRLSRLYQRIATDVPDPRYPILDLPPIDKISRKIAESSFLVFASSASYGESLRALAYPSWSSLHSTGMGSEVYRVFFNDYSKKLYVDVNGSRLVEARRLLDEEAFLAEILKTMIFVVTCVLPDDEPEPAPVSSGGDSTTSPYLGDTTEIIDIPTKK